jgi:phosphate transport system permease protein
MAGRKSHGTTLAPPPPAVNNAQLPPVGERTVPESGRKRAGAFTATDLRRRFRLLEFLTERFVKTVALTSLAAIVMIFIFVFRETVPLLTGKGTPAPAAHREAAEEQETYGDEYLGQGAKGLEESKKRSASVETAGAEGNASVGNLLSTSWQPVAADPKYGLLPLAVGSLKVTLIALLLAAPIAILAALFTSSFAPRWGRELLKPTIELLAGFPSVVIGFFALVTLATFMQQLFGFEYRLNAFVGGVAMSLAVIPIVFTVAEDALAAVPRSMTEASLALGASKWQTAVFVVLPAATPGVFAALLLGFGRAFGETMIVLMATGNAALLDWGLSTPVRTMSATVGAEMAEVVFGDTHYHVLFLIGAILFVFTFALNALAEGWVRQRLLRRFRGESA